MTFDEGVQFLSKWQKILRIQDWDIIIKWVSPKDLVTGQEAEITFHRRYKQAIIKVVRAEYEWPSNEFDDVFNNPRHPQHFQRIIIHELLHIVVFKFTTEDQEEEAVEQLTKVLLGLTDG